MADEATGDDTFGTERVLAFSDGVFAIAITLLVLNLTIPAVHHDLLTRTREVKRAPGQPSTAAPQSFVDAGDVPWIELAPLLTRSLAELLRGEVLELQTGDRETILALPGWCAGEGYTLIHAQPGDGFISFWIGK